MKHLTLLKLLPKEFLMSAVLLLILVVLLFMYGFHGILKFNAGINYLGAIIFGLLAALMCVAIVIVGLRYVSNKDVSDEEKKKIVKGMMMLGVVALVFAIIAFVRYNYGKLYSSLNRTLPANKSILPKLGRKRGRRGRRGKK